MPDEQGHIATGDGVHLYFERFGHGPNALIIPNGFYLAGDFEPLGDRRTVIFYDARNRGRSDPVNDASKLARGIQNDVDDIEAVRRHFGLAKVSLLGHSYMGVTVALYAMKYTDHVNRVVQIGSMPPDAARPYPAHLTGADATLNDVMAKLGELQKERQSYEPVEFCRKFWSLLRVIYVANPADAGKIQWDRCELPNELNFMKYWMGTIFPSIRSLKITADDFAKVTMPVLIVHGARDRSSAYGGARDWATRLPDARLVTIENAGHAPWIESPEVVFGSIETFLDGSWPEIAERLTPTEV